MKKSIKPISLEFEFQIPITLLKNEKDNEIIEKLGNLIEPNKYDNCKINYFV